MSNGATGVEPGFIWPSKACNLPPQPIDNSHLHHVTRTVNYLIFNYSRASQPSFSPEDLVSADQELACLGSFIAHVVQSANVSVTALIAALVYIRRLVSHPHDTNISPETSYSIFLAAVIVATKFLYDRPKPSRNKHWRKYCRFEECGISTRDINRAERQLLEDLGWKVALTERDMREEFERFELSCWMPVAEHKLPKANLNTVPNAVKLTSRLLQKCMRSIS